MGTTSVDWIHAIQLADQAHPGRLVQLQDTVHSDPRQGSALLRRLFQADPVNPVPVDSVLDLFSAQVKITFQQGFDWLIGIPRKGAALLQEAGLRANLEPSRMTSLENLPPDLNGKAILLVDDSIHHGQMMSRILEDLKDRGCERITVLVLLATPEGLEWLRKKFGDSNVPVTFQCLLAVPDASLSFHFQRFLAPALFSLQTGFLTDRVGLNLKVEAHETTPSEVISKILQVLCSLDIIAEIIVPSIGKTVTNVLPCTAILSSEMENWIGRQFPDSVDLEICKLRIYIGTPEPTSVNIYPILYLRGGPGIRIEELQALEKRIAERLVAHIEPSIKEQLARHCLSTSSQ